MKKQILFAIITCLSLGYLSLHAGPVENSLKKEITKLKQQSQNTWKSILKHHGLIMGATPAEQAAIEKILKELNALKKKIDQEIKDKEERLDALAKYSKVKTKELYELEQKKYKEQEKKNKQEIEALDKNYDKVMQELKKLEKEMS